jgi:RNA binding exosome subunit
MSAVPLHYVELRTFAYATEDDDLVAGALRTFLPEDVELEGAYSESHHGAPILVLSARVENAEEIRHVLDRLATLPAEEWERVRAELDDRIDADCNLFVSLSKQAAAEGDVRLGEGITLRGKVEAYPAKQPAAVENASEAFAEIGHSGDDAGQDSVTAEEAVSGPNADETGENR